MDILSPLYAAASELVTVLGGLPLALDQAGAYLEETRCGLSAYLDLFRTQRAALLQQRGEGAHDHPASVSTTFTLAITAAVQRDPAVEDLLQICALLQPDAIPEELFRQGGQHLGPALEAVCCDPLGWDRVVGMACSYSLLSRQPEAHTLSMHRLVQAVLLDEMRETEREQWNRRVIEALNTVFPEIGRETTSAVWYLCERLLPHVLLSSRRDGGSSESLACASLDYKTAFYLFQRGQYREAEPLFERALQTWEQVLGPDHPRVAAALHNLADLYREQGKYEAAEPLFLHALRIWEQVWGPEDTDVAYALGGLAELSREVGNYQAAESFFLRALRIREQWFGLEHPRVAQLLHGLAALSLKQEQVEQAELLYQQALSIRERSLGLSHPETAETLHDLVLLRQKQGNLDEAISLSERALKIRSQSLGDTHPKTIATRTLYAQLFQEQTGVQEKAASKLGVEKTPDPRSEECHAERASLLSSASIELSPSANNPLQGFLAACCELHPRAWCRSADLWQAYKQWTEEQQERYPLSRGAFIAQLKMHGCRADRTMAARIWRGIAMVKKDS